MTAQPSHRGDLLTPSLPKGGGAIHSIGTGWGAVGMTGTASFQVPLPLSPGRGFAPTIALSYHSTLGNGPFGLGWSASAGSISRSTLRGVPAYDDDDVYIGPAGVELRPERTALGAPAVRTVDQFNTLPLGTSFNVLRYLPRHESSFDRIEHWSCTTDTAGFWLVQTADGHCHLFGKTASARLADPTAPTHVAQWLLEESLNPLGEQIYYQYKTDTQPTPDRNFSAQRYLSRVCYANLTARGQLALWTENDPAPRQWHFELVFDYGERTTVPSQAPPYLPQQDWLERSDPFFSYAYGFELGSRRLCRQMLMFHNFPEETAMGLDPVLTRRLLLEYSTTETGINLLHAVHEQACAANGDLSHWPPLELTYSPFTLAPDPAHYRPFDALHGSNNSEGYQLLDLYSDGLPGVLFRNDKHWLYREPMRGAQASDAREVTYGPLQALKRAPLSDLDAPLLQALTDLNGDGQLEWVIAQPGMSGFFTLERDRQWSGFVPFSAFPQEFFHPQGHLADLMGNGIHDLALIGSNSVRLYTNLGTAGFAAGTHIAHEHEDDRLPLLSNSPTELLAFSDILGSGQQHLVRIRHNEIKCWPNLGRGRFGKGFVFASLPFAYADFEASRVLLADLDGSGASDVIYLEPDQALIFMNRCGNGLHNAPTSLPWPDGVRHDRFCHVSAADLQGLGCSSLILTVTHPAPRHWRYDFVTEKPYLLTGTDNNMGAVGRLSYRSSAQEWLDEKAQHRAATPPPASGLPFALHLVSEQQQYDQISGNQLTQRFTYRDAYYDNAERRFQGFGLVQATDTEQPLKPASNPSATAPLLRKTWFHTGKAIDPPRDGFWAADTLAHQMGLTLLTRLEAGATQDTVVPLASATDLSAMKHALSGRVLREEVYAADDPEPSRIPYTVSQHRYLLRQVQACECLLVLPVESQVYRYERQASDPACQHMVQLRWDRYGNRVHGLTVDYARRQRASDPPPFSDAHQQTWWRDTHDPAQQVHYISEIRAAFIHLDGADRWRLGLPYRQRSNALVFEKNALAPERIRYELLIENTADNPVGPDAKRTLSGLSVQYYCMPGSLSPLATGQASFQALAACQETAELDEQALTAYDDVSRLSGQPPFDLTQALEQEHYQAMPLFLSARETDTSNVTLWSLKQGYTRYAPEHGFYRPNQLQATQSHATTNIDHDRYHLHVTSVTAMDGCITKAAYDYRLLLPIEITDPQGSVQQVRYDAFGQLLVSSVYGQEQGKPVGFAPVAEYQRPADDSPSAAIANPHAALLNAASACFYAPFSWMGHIAPSSRREYWIAQGYLTVGGYIRASTRAQLTTLSMSEPDLSEAVRQSRREPVHGAVLRADNYPTIDQSVTRAIHIDLTYNDGFARPLQTCRKTSAGDAYRLDSMGHPLLDTHGKPLLEQCEQRWRISGGVEYNNKGLVIRNYSPYFADQYRYLQNGTLRQHGYSDHVFYDPLGRPVHRLNTKGHSSRTTYCTWYTINEDENDTAQD
ncbi:SpvB/TcaC N-terminal domain-containing protein [Pseudomonas sp.]|uniref:SpvB/TcaC N-terminal domain-containing protein n=1 Tax=Pseudomonas sp. TaxID=306 RepID=UPI002601886E|nr:SpvB/TcaC N-terminal domain-containing protein [Pseudomonas sp.]